MKKPSCFDFLKHCPKASCSRCCSGSSFPAFYFFISLLDSFIHSSQTVLGYESSEVLHKQERKGKVVFSGEFLELEVAEMLPSCLAV